MFELSTSTALSPAGYVRDRRGEFKIVGRTNLTYLPTAAAGMQSCRVIRELRRRPLRGANG